MTRARLTDSTKGPARRAITIVSLGAAALAVIMTVAMVIVALTGMSNSALRFCFVTWVISLGVVFAGTRLLKSGHDD